MFGGINGGDARPFTDHALVDEGLVDHRRTVHIQCWEQDFYNPRFRAQLFQELRAFTIMIVEVLIDQLIGPVPPGKPELYAAGIVLVGLAAHNLVALLVSMFTGRDDLVCERTLIRDAAALAQWNGTSQVFRFDGGGDGLHKLRVRTAAVRVPELGQLKSRGGPTPNANLHDEHHAS
ncbi:hypothetical protein ACFY12_09000 [Streptomyces sp. NPDC001339]|uniref:hypothetical protein n=1 Tax=Streptomyces sp. NPDC001339 TaxID=3364563 RepID=UPI0036885C98